MTNTVHTLDRPIIEEIREIIAAGYPSVEYHEPEGAATIGRLNWWRTTEREADLFERYERAIDCEDDDDLEAVLKELLEYGDEIVSATIAVIAKRRNLNELCHLLDAAAKNGSATLPLTSGGAFMRKIAELAIKGLAAE